MRLLTALCLAAYLLLDSEAALLRAREAMALWAYAVAPSLFPFLALLPALTDDQSLKVYERLFGKAMNRLFRVSGACAAPCLIGLIAGSPAGSVATLRAYQAGAISGRDARVLSALSTGVGPVFIISSVGGGMMNDVSQGVRLLACVWISSFLTAFLVSFIRREGDNTFFEGGRCENPPGAIREAVFGILTVAGYMTFFRVFAGGLPGSIYAFFEVSGGCSVAAESDNFVMASAVIGFGGICLIVQNHAFLKKTKVCFWEFVGIKALTCALCTLLGRLLPKLTPFERGFSPDAYMFSCMLAISMALLCLGLAAASHVYKRHGMKQNEKQYTDPIKGMTRK